MVRIQSDYGARGTVDVNRICSFVSIFVKGWRIQTRVGGRANTFRNNCVTVEYFVMRASAAFFRPG